MKKLFFDAHTHLSASEAKVVSHGESQVSRIINSTCPEEWIRFARLTDENKKTASQNWLLTCGLHPWNLAEAGLRSTWQAQFLEALETWAGGIGEVGLHRDQHTSADSFAAQQVALRWQLSVAVKRNLPVSIHCVQAAGALVALLETTGAPKRGVHLHDFRGSAELVKRLAKYQTYFSVGPKLGPLTKKRTAFLCAIPEGRLFLETDQAAQDGAMRMRLLQETATALADIRGQTPTEILKVTEANARKYFFGP